MSTIELIGVTKSWQQTVAIDDVSFVVPESQFVVLLGPSGCGKSTTLRMIAGLESVTTGTVKISGTDVTDLPPAERRISMVFQSYALFPHLNVAENIIFGLRVRKVGAAERGARLEKVAELVGLSELIDRKPAQLSGGQRQRVALARAIIAENPICLMDEPLSNLDAKLRHEMRIEIRALQNRLGMTVVYVTHDQTEAMSMADKVILMRDGRIEQEGSPDELYKRPETIFTAQFIGTPPMNVLTLKGSAKGSVLEGAEQYPVANGRGPSFKLGVRPEDVSISDDGVPARLVSADYLGADSIVTARIGPQELVFRLSGHVHVKDGDEVKLRWAKDATHLFDAVTGRRASI